MSFTKLSKILLFSFKGLSLIISFISKNYPKVVLYFCTRSHLLRTCFSYKSLRLIRLNYGCLETRT